MFSISSRSASSQREEPPGDVVHLRVEGRRDAVADDVEEPDLVHHAAQLVDEGERLRRGRVVAVRLQVEDREGEGGGHRGVASWARGGAASAGAASRRVARRVRRAVSEPARVGMAATSSSVYGSLGACVDLVGRALLDDSAVVEHHDGSGTGGAPPTGRG